MNFQHSWMLIFTPWRNVLLWRALSSLIVLFVAARILFKISSEDGSGIVLGATDS